MREVRKVEAEEEGVEELRRVDLNLTIESLRDAEGEEEEEGSRAVKTRK